MVVIIKAQLGESGKLAWWLGCIHTNNRGGRSVPCELNLFHCAYLDLREVLVSTSRTKYFHNKEEQDFNRCANI